MDVVRALLVTLAVLVGIYVVRWWTALSRSRSLLPAHWRVRTHRD
jgi:hypothetical protein